MSKVISHGDRISASNIHYSKNLSSPYVINSVEDILENNRIVKKSKRQTINPADKFKGFKVSDFYMENVIAVGAEDSLRFGQVSIDNLSAADNIEAQIPVIDSFIENNLNDGGNE